MGSRFPMWRLVVLAAMSTSLLFGCAGEVHTIGFGTGGTDCEPLEDVGSTFPAGSTVRMVATMSPLPTSVVVHMMKDGDTIQGPETVYLNGMSCLGAELRNVAAGQYEFELTIPGSQLPPLTGSFDVTP